MPLGSPQDGNCPNGSCGTSSSPRNADVDGIAVCGASVVLTICLRILITWSPEDIDVGVQASFLQIYSILLSTLLSINRQQLSLEDVYFALNLTSSPLTTYLVVASICNLCGTRTGLYKRIKSYHRVMKSLGALIPPLWLALTMVFYLSNHAFTDSDQLGNRTFKKWLLSLLEFIFDAIMLGACPPVDMSIIAVFAILFLFRGWSQLVAEVRPCLESKPWGRFRLPFTFIKSAWRIIDRNHKWFVYLVFAYIDFWWAFMSIDFALRYSSNGYVLSYGQVLSVFSAVSPLASTVKFVYSSRWDLLRFAQSFPRRCRVEVVYLITGKKTDHLVCDILPLTAPASVLLKPQETFHGSPPEESLQSDNPTGPPDKPAHGSHDDVASPDASHTYVFFFPYDVVEHRS